MKFFTKSPKNIRDKKIFYSEFAYFLSEIWLKRDIISSVFERVLYK